MDIRFVAKQVCEFLLRLHEVKNCNIYGSIANCSYDDYSDIDIEIDVSGIDNSVYITKLPEIIAKKYEIVFVDYAPSLAPEKYVVSIAISSDNPFLIVDICCTATPHYATLLKNDLVNLNNHYEHTLKLFSANLKHYIRGIDCYNDIEKMYGRIFRNTNEIKDEKEMLDMVFSWLHDNAKSKYSDFLNSLSSYL